MVTPELKTVRYVVDQRGRKSAVQVDIKTWQALLAYLEDLEDRALVHDKFPRLTQGPQESGAISFQQVREQW
jgi:hypothetical protein